MKQYPIKTSRHSKRRPTNLPLEFQKLEPRMMLAGDVTVFISDIQLFVVGDDAANQVQIIGSVNGSARVVGLDGTTINGGTSEFVANLPGLRYGDIRMNGGNDEVDVLGVRFNNGLFVHGGAGNDSMMVRNSSIGQFQAFAGGGDDILQINNLFATRSSTIDMAAGNDMIAVMAHAAGDNIFVRAGAGDDILAVDNMGMFGQLQVDMSTGNDQILMAGETWVGRDSRINLGSGDDFIGVLPDRNSGKSQWQKFTTVDGGAGNDNVAFGAQVTMRTGSLVDGNLGTDIASYNPANLTDATITRFETGQFNLNAMLDEIYASIGAADIDPGLFGGDEILTLALNMNTTALNFPENSQPQSIDAALELQGPNAIVVTTATVTITGFVAGQDTLAFTDTGNITGSFDDTTGVLTLTGEGTLSDYQAALRTVTFSNDSETPSEVDRFINVAVTTSEGDLAAERILNVVAVNDPPELSDSGDLNFDIDDTNLARPAVLNDQLQLTDLDTTEFGSATIQILSGLETGDVLGFADQNGIVGSYDAATGTLTLTGISSLENYQTALRSITFDNSESRATLGTRNIRFTISDGVATATSSFDLVVNASQTIEVSVSDGNQTFVESSDPVAVDDAFLINADNGNENAEIAGATVQIASGYVINEDALTFTPATGISGSFDATTGILTFTGTGTSDAYSKLIRSVNYLNNRTGTDFTNGERVIEFAVEREGLIARANRTLEVIDVDEQLIRDYVAANNLPATQTTDSGLHYIIEQEGNGNFPTATSDVNVRYRGTLRNGFEFDANTFTFNLQGVIPGWTEGIPLFSEGGSGMLLIPSNLGYGERGQAPDIGPNEVLIFEVELLQVLS